MPLYPPASTGSVTTVTATSPITSSGGATPNVSTSIATNRLVGRGTAGTGVIEEIILGTNLSLTGTTLNASGGGGGAGSGEIVDLGDRIIGSEILDIGQRV